MIWIGIGIFAVGGLAGWYGYQIRLAILALKESGCVI